MVELLKIQFILNCVSPDAVRNVEYTINIISRSFVLSLQKIILKMLKTRETYEYLSYLYLGRYFLRYLKSG